MVRSSRLGLCSEQSSWPGQRAQVVCTQNLSRWRSPHSAVSLQRLSSQAELWWYQLGDRLSTLEWFWPLVTRHGRETGSDANLGMQLPPLYSDLKVFFSVFAEILNPLLHHITAFAQVLQKVFADWSQQAGGLKNFWLQRRD